MNKQTFVSRLEKMSLSNGGGSSSGRKLDLGANSSANSGASNSIHSMMRNGAGMNSREASTISIKNMFKESANSTSQRSGSANSLIGNFNSDIGNNNGLVTTLLRLNQHRWVERSRKIVYLNVVLIFFLLLHICILARKLGIFVLILFL